MLNLTIKHIISAIEDKVREGKTWLEFDFDKFPELNNAKYRNYILYYLNRNGFKTEVRNKKQIGYRYIHADKEYIYIDCKHLYIKWHPTFCDEKLDYGSMAYNYYIESKKNEQ